jgi:hypothetical protein
MHIQLRPALFDFSPLISGTNGLAPHHHKPGMKSLPGAGLIFLAGGVVVGCCTSQLSKARNEDHTMRLLILAAAASLVLTGAVSAKETRHHHSHDASASVAGGSAPADTLSAHDAHILNLRDSGYNPAGDHDGAGNIKQN